MTFDEILTHVTDLRQRDRRVSYRALKLRFDLNDEYVEGLKDELIAAKILAGLDRRGFTAYRLRGRKPFQLFP
jgi:hypothetical protein